MKFAIVFLSLLISIQVFAAGKVGTKVTTYESDDGAELSIVSYVEDEQKDFLLLFNGFESEWDGKALLHSVTEGANKKYVYGAQYQSVVDSGGKTLRSGTVTPTIDVYAKGTSKKKVLWLSKPKHKPDEILKAYKPAP